MIEKMDNINSKSLPLISIITVVYNGEKYLEKTINSIQEQTYQNIEYIIVDGGSSDRTLEIAKNYEDFIDILVSEKDNGIYDAMNKGIVMASGDYIGFLNADDWYETNALESIFSSTKFDDSYDIVYGNFNICDLNSNYIYTYKSSLNKIKNTMTIGHPALFIKSKVHKDTLFDLNFSISADYDLILSLLEKNIKILYINKSIVNFRLDGISTTTNVGMECFRVHKKHFGIFHSLNQLLLYQLNYLKTKSFIALLGEKKFNNIKGLLKTNKFWKYQ